MQAFDEHARREAFARLQELISIGRQYDAFARDHPSEAEAQISALNAPGRQAEAWDLTWLPDMLRARIARVSSIVVLDLCRAPEDHKENLDLIDVLMPAAILTACVVGHTYGVKITIPANPLRGRLAVFAALLHRILDEQPEALDAIAHASGSPSPPLPPLVSCLPPHIRGRLMGLAHLMAPRADPVRVKIVTTIFLIGAVATETFEPLHFCGDPS